MKIDKNYAILVVIIGIVIIYFVVLKKKSNQGLTWKKCEKDNWSNKLFIETLGEHGFEKTNDNNWNILLPCGADFSTKTLSKVKNKTGFPYFLANNYHLGLKKGIWNSLKNKYGRDVAKEIIPTVYIFPKDERLFKKEYKSGDFYFLKKEKQRQTGLDFSNNYNALINHKKNKYSLIQKFIGNTVTFLGHRMNFRIYFVILNRGKMIQSFKHNDGIISYSKSPIADVPNYDSCVASFYTSKDLYKKGFPIIYSELKKKLQLPWKEIERKMKIKLNLLTNSIKDKMNQYKGFQLFGVDFVIDQSFEPWLLEANIGPGMTPFNENDKKMRKNVYENIIYLLKNKKTKFEKIY